MNGKQHLKYYILCITVFSTIGWFIYDFTWKFVLALYGAFFLINPDYDLLFGYKHHRNPITHSILYPLSIYFIYHDYFNMENADFFGILLFLPCLIHLVGDFRIKHLIDEDHQRGSWLFSLFGKRWSPQQTKTWVFINVGIMLLYISLVLSEAWEEIVEFFNSVL